MAEATESSAAPSSAVTFEGVVRQFEEVRALDGVSFEIAEGEFFSFLGPSGSGKTTCLRLIAGFDEPDAGRILLEGVPCAGVPPYNRNVNTVFQDYALFPHMSVAENIAYGLMVKGVGKAERLKRAEEMLDLVNLAGYGRRRPGQLSGGQRQRVALARALVNRPRLLLLDEPLGALDLKLREQMQGELKTLQRRLRITFIYVTHDQQEALSMSDRIAVFNEGRIEQIADPATLYNRPASAFVARFVGISNIVGAEAARRLGLAEEGFSIRPEHVRPLARGAGPAADEVALSVEVVNVLFQGAATRLDMVAEGGPGEKLELVMIRPSAAHEADGLSTGDRLRVAWRRDFMVPLAESAGASRDEAAQ